MNKAAADLDIFTKDLLATDEGLKKASAAVQSFLQSFLRQPLALFEKDYNKIIAELRKNLRKLNTEAKLSGIINGFGKCYKDALIFFDFQHQLSSNVFTAI